MTESVLSLSFLINGGISMKFIDKLLAVTLAVMTVIAIHGCSQPEEPVYDDEPAVEVPEE